MQHCACIGIQIVIYNSTEKSFYNYPHHRVVRGNGSMDEKRKKSFLFFGSLFVAVIFLSSYASFGSNGNPLQSNSTTTIKLNIVTNYASGDVNGTIRNYSKHFSISAKNGTNATTLADLINKLEANNSINSYSGGNLSYSIDQGTMNAFDIYKLLQSNHINASFSVTSTVKLPAEAYLRNQNYSYYTVLPNATYKFPLSSLLSIGSNVPVHIIATGIYQSNSSVFRISPGSIHVTLKQ